METKTKNIIEKDTPIDADNVKMGEVILQLKDVQKTFGSNHVLKDINLSVKKGETIVVLGKSGTGKSVVLKCIIGLIKPDAGEILAFGEDITKMNLKQLEIVRKKMGFLFQGGALYDSMTVRENLLFPLDRQPGNQNIDKEAKVKEALENVGLLRAIDLMPSEISGGMQKRIALARTLILDPEIILYDEPTTGLDPVTSKEISALMVKLQKKYNVTSIVVTHDMPCAKTVASRIEMLKNGEFYKEGTYAELEKSDDEFVRGFFEFD